MSNKKRDAGQIEATIAALRGANWLGPARRWWPDYVFHFTEIRNAVSILTGGKLLARSHGGMVADIASATVIENTQDHWKDFVRLYFRPRTPTQYNNEGIRPSNRLSQFGAHCPVPIFLLFDATDVLTRESTGFSEGSLAADSRVGTNAQFFASIPFEKVYHDSWMPDAEKGTIKFHRHAEIIVPNELDLSALRFIVCRSEAEYQTLRQMLHVDVFDEFAQKTIHSSGNLFFRKWTFVETANLGFNRVTFAFNKSSQTPSPFKMARQIRDTHTLLARIGQRDARRLPASDLV